jgi:hypothetical protein
VVDVGRADRHHLTGPDLARQRGAEAGGVGQHGALGPGRGEQPGPGREELTEPDTGGLHQTQREHHADPAQQTGVARVPGIARSNEASSAGAERARELGQ